MEGTLTGRTLAHYEILELLGIGGAAEVYRALDLTSDREVALKILYERADPAMVLRFTREAKALALLQHPNIVNVYDAGYADNQRYLAMELVGGGSLKERLQDGPLDWPEAVRIAIQVAEALGHAHKHGIIHRDLKPANIMLDGDRVKLMDFGLAHVADASAMTRTGTVMGTVFYLSPEQAVGKHVDQRSDLYSLGAVLFEMLVGEPPFTGPSAVSVIYRHLNEQPAHIRQFDESFPPLLDGIVDRLLQKDPEKRFANVEETIAALAATLSIEDDEPLPVGTSDFEAQVQGHSLPLVGREDELALLTAALERTVSGMGSTILISGEAGTGKTRLAYEVRRLAQDHNALTLIGDCLYGDAPNPYACFVDIITSFRSQWLPAGRGDDASELDVEIETLLRDVQRMLRIDMPSSTDDAPWLQQLSLMDGQAQAFELITQFFVQASRARPLVIVLDDLQWASATALHLFHYLARAIRGTHILLLGSYRPEELLPGVSGDRHPLRETLQRMSRERLYDEVRLGELTDDEVATMVAQALNVPTVDPEFVELLHRESEGNPFYLLETLALLQEQGALERVGDHWELMSGLGEVEVPGSVYDVVMRRVERTNEQDRDLLDWAAVLGQRLDVPLLTSLVGGTRLTVMKRLHALEQRYGLLSCDQNGFQFSHGKIREILYEELPPTLRRECHLVAGEALQELAGKDIDRYVYDLARHFVRAADRIRGFRYARLAAHKAEEALAISEAASYLAEALSFLRDGDELGGGAEVEMELRHRHGRLLSLLGRLDEAREEFEAALRISRRGNHREMEATLLLALSSSKGREGEWEEAVALALESLDFARQYGLPKQQADALLSAGFYAFERGEWEGAINRLRDALRIATQNGNALQRARILGNMAIMYNARGQAAKAIALYRESIEVFDRLGHPLDVARGLSNMGFSHHSLGEYEQALACYAQALERLGKVGDVRELGLLYLHIAETSLAQGDLAKARENCTLASRRFSRLGFDLGIADVGRVYAGIAMRERRWKVAERYLRAALAVYEEHGDQLNIAETRAELSTLLEEQGSDAEAEEEMSRSRIIFERLLEDSSPDIVIGQGQA